MLKSLSRTKKLIIAIVISVVAFALQVAGITVAWLSNRNEVNPEINKGSYIQQYFDSGTGTESDPFIITRPAHYFHLTELYQRNSEFAEQGLAGHPYYFQVGKKFADAPNPDKYYVYGYDDTGAEMNGDSKYSDVLNMAFYCGDLALLPIGTSETPFNGVINGNKIQVSNLHIKATETIYNSEGEVEKTFKSADIGIFGYIYGYLQNNTYHGGYVHDLYFDDVTLDLSGLDYTANSVASYDHIIGHSDSKIYVGYIAGHMPVLGFDEEDNIINCSGILENVYINDCRVIGASEEEGYNGAPVSELGLIGHIDNLGTGTIKSINEYISDAQSDAPTKIETHGQGDIEVESLGWGASLDMYATFTRLQSLRNLAITEGERNEDKPSFYLYLGQRDNDVYGGSYYFSLGNNNSNVVFLSGVYGQEDTNFEYNDGFFIHKNSNFIGLNGINIKNVGSVDTAKNFYWELIDDQKYLTTVIDEVTYYMNADVYGNISLATTPSTTWSSDDSFISTRINNEDYYLTYHNNKWCVVRQGLFYNIKYVSHYLTIDINDRSLGISSLTPTDLLGSNGKYYYSIGGINYYLSQDISSGNYSLFLSTDESKRAIFLEDTNGLYVKVGNDRFYLIYDYTEGEEGWKFQINEFYYLIADGNNYLTINNGELISTTKENATHWLISKSNNAYHEVYFIDNLGTTYYLVCDTSNNDNFDVYLSSSIEQRMTWKLETSADENYIYTNLSVSKQGLDYYLVYKDGKWVISKTGVFFTIKDGNNYLYIDSGGNVTASATQGTEFRKEEDHLYIYREGVKYYLTIENSSMNDTDVILSPGVTSACSWIFEPNDPDDSLLLYTNMCVDRNGFDYYIMYDSVASVPHWKVFRTGEVFYIKDYSNYLVVEDGEFTVGTASEATGFIKEGNKYFIFEGTDRKYLSSDSYHPQLTDEGDSWVRDEGDETAYFYTKKSDGNLNYLVYDTEDSEWKIFVSGSFITVYDEDSDVYLHSDKDGNLGASSESSTLWQFTDHIVTCITPTGTKYLLADKDTFVVYLSDTYVPGNEFSIGDEISAPIFKSLYQNIDGLTYKLRYNSTSSCWELSKFGQLYMIADNGNYLQVKSDFSLGTSEDIDATQWVFDTENETDGPLYTVIDGLTYYLMRKADCSLGLELSPIEPTIWHTSENNDCLYTIYEYYSEGSSGTDPTVVDELEYYVAYEDGHWTLKLYETSYIFRQDNYNLFVDTTTLAVSKNLLNSTTFYKDNLGYLYTLRGNTRLFLNKSAGVALVVETNPVTTWSVPEGTDGAEMVISTAFTMHNGFEYFVTLIDDNWYLEVNKNYFTISSGDTYFNYNYPANSNIPNEPTKWYVGPNNIVYMINRANSQVYYLYNNPMTSDGNSLSFDLTNRTEFYFDESDGKLYTVKSGFLYYVGYVNNQWKLIYVGEQFAIYDDEYFMTNISTRVVGSNGETPKYWFYRDNYIITFISGNIYYLSLGSDDVVYLGEEPTTEWTLRDNDSDTGEMLSTEINGNVYFVNYNQSLNRWGVEKLEYYKIIYDINNNFVVGDPDTRAISRTNRADQATLFIQEGNGYYILDSWGNKRYLSFNTRTEIVVLDTAPVEWIYNDSLGTFSSSYSGIDYYLTYDGIKWIVSQPEECYQIKDINTGLYLGLNGNSVVASTTPTDWNLEELDGIFYLFSRNGSRKLYLNISAGEEGFSPLETSSYPELEVLFLEDGEANETDILRFFSWETEKEYRIGLSGNSWVLYEMMSFTIENELDNGDLVALNVEYSSSTDETIAEITAPINSDNLTQWYFTGGYDEDGITVVKTGSYKYGVNKSVTRLTNYINSYGGILYTFDENGVRWYLSQGDTGSTEFELYMDTDSGYAVEWLYANFDNVPSFIAYNASAPSTYRAQILYYNEFGVWEASCTDGPEFWITMYDSHEENILCSLAANTVRIIVSDVEHETSLRIIKLVSDKPDTTIISIEITVPKNLYVFDKDYPAAFIFDKMAESFNVIVTMIQNDQPPDLVLLIPDDVSKPTNIEIARVFYDKPETVTIEQLIQAMVGSEIIENNISLEQITISIELNIKVVQVDIDLTTYTPLITKLDDYIGDATFCVNKYSASMLNTGYIVSGNYQTESDSPYESDIRVASYSYEDSLRPSANAVAGITEFTSDSDSKMEIITYKDGNYYRITDLKEGHNTSHVSIPYGLSTYGYEAKTVLQLGLNGYESPEVGIELARDKFASALLKNPSSVYGLHFMDSKISMDHIITAKNVSLLETRYDYYELPEDSIDFNVYEHRNKDGEIIRQGTINFFAGTYYQGNNAFFSLHQIIRDEINPSIILDIKEIKKIYYNPLISQDYVYQFGETIPDGYSINDLVFDLEWLTNPSEIVPSAIYYFEIPVNAGEYALGSVENKTGAYLLYLDVANKGASSGGTILDPDSPLTPAGSSLPAAVISNSPLINNVDYRMKSQEIEIDDGDNHSLKLYVGYDIPEDAERDDFSIEIHYQEANERDDYEDITWCQGVYQIFIKNLTGEKFNMDVLLVDPVENRPEGYEYPFAYEISLWNGSEYVVMQNNEVAYTTGYRGSLRRWSNTYEVYSSYIRAVTRPTNV